MRTLKLLTLLIAGAALHASTARAQACLGLPSFAAGSLHLNGAGEFPDSATSYAVGIGGGTRDGLFGTVGGGQVSYTGLDGKTTLGFLELGLERPVLGARLCPVAGGYLAAGPDDDLAGIKVTSRSATAGLAVGLPIDLPGPRLTLVPNAALKYVFVSQRVDEADVGSATESYSAGVLDLGLGLVLLDRVGIQPLIHIPIADDAASTSFGLFASVAFGWPLR